MVPFLLRTMTEAIVLGHGGGGGGIWAVAEWRMPRMVTRRVRLVACVKSILLLR